MPHTRMTLTEAAGYLHLAESEVLALFRNNEIPAIPGPSPVFMKQELHDWLARKLLGAEQKPIVAYHTSAGRIFEPLPQVERPFVSTFILPECIALNVSAKSKTRVLRELVKLAAQSNLVSDDEEFMGLVEERESLCSTALCHGVAMPHSRVHDEYLIFETFMVVMILETPIHFGADDNQPTDVFLMPCAHDDRIHLYMIARLARLLHDTAIATDLRACEDAEDVIGVFRAHECEFAGV